MEIFKRSEKKNNDPLGDVDMSKPFRFPQKIENNSTQKTSMEGISSKLKTYLKFLNLWDNNEK